MDSHVVFFFFFDMRLGAQKHPSGIARRSSGVLQSFRFNARVMGGQPLFVVVGL